MNRSSIRFSLFVAAALTVASAAVAQNWPFPDKKPNTPVPCPASSPACVGKEGLLTAPYSDAIKTFVGRYLDSQNTRELQSPLRTLRARRFIISPERNRIYMIVGSTLASYDLPSFFQRLEAGEPLVPATSVGYGGNWSMRGSYPETFLKWDSFFYAEKSSWTIFNVDGQDRLFGFDFDDRGYVYPAYNPYGWGILQDVKGASMANMESVFQQLPNDPKGDLTPNTVISVKTSSGAYFLIVSPNSGSVSNVYYVGDAAGIAHDKRADIRHVISAFTKATNGRIATIEGDGRLHVYSNDGIVSGSELASFSPSDGTYSALDTDGTNFYAVSQAGFQGVNHAKLTILSADAGGNYTKQPEIDLERPYVNVPTIRYGAGYILLFGQEGFVAGTDGAAAPNLRLYKLAGNTLTPVPVLVGSVQPVNPQAPLARQYFANYYFRNSAAGYTAPIASGVDGASMGDARIFKYNGRFFLIVAASGIGDVYELTGADSTVAKVKTVGRTPNPKAAGVAGAGPFYGDEVTFTSTSSSAAPPAVNWSFTGDANVYPRSPISPDIAYQFSGLTKDSFAAGPVVRTATATVDANNSDSVQVRIQAPQIRLGIAGHPELLFTQPDVSSSAPIVTSDQWIDASDGAMEGHYTDWNLDSSVTTKMPDQATSVGGCGTHTLIFTTHYGPNNAQNTSPSFTMKSTEATYDINPFKYNVAPFSASVNDPRVDPGNAANILFTANVRTTDSTADLPSLGSTPATYTWTLLNNDGTPTDLTQSGPGTLASPTGFSVPKTRFGSATMQVRLVIAVAPSATRCVNFASQSLTKPNLSGPTGSITVAGCTELGAPCSFSFGTPNPAWHYSWSATGAGNVPAFSGDGVGFATFTPQFPVEGPYTISVTVDNAIGSVTPAPAHISLLPPSCLIPTAASTSISYFGPASGSFCQSDVDVCGLGETITFLSQPHGWVKQACHQYEWDFGDNTAHSTAEQPTHVYNIAGKYTVTMTIKAAGVSGSMSLQKSITIGNGNTPPPPPPDNGGGPPPPPPAGCGTLTDTSVYLGYSGVKSLCSPNFGDCDSGEAVSFSVYGNGYNLGCTNHSFGWNFGDPGSLANSSSEQFPVHAFSNAGTYKVFLTVNNGNQSTTVSINVKVAGGTPAVCPPLNASNIGVGYSSSTVPTCRPGANCGAGEPIDFHIDLNGYPSGCSVTSFQWNFGAGTSTSATPSFAFPNAGDYNASVTVSNATTPTPITIPFTVKVVKQVGSCPEMTPVNVYFGWYGATSGCTPGSTGGNCRDSEDVGFQVYGNGYQFLCSTHTFTWDFDDGSDPAVGQAILHHFRHAGQFDVSVKITNTAGGSITLTQRVNVANQGGTVPVPVSRKRPSKH